MARLADEPSRPGCMGETDWLVDIVMMPEGDSERSESLAYIGRLFAFAIATDTRFLAAVGAPEIPTYELWFSFSSDKEKQRFLQMVREDGYADPDDEACFNPPVNLKDELAGVRPIAETFPKEQHDYIVAVAMTTAALMGIDPISWVN